MKGERLHVGIYAHVLENNQSLRALYIHRSGHSPPEDGGVPYLMPISTLLGGTSFGTVLVMLHTCSSREIAALATVNDATMVTYRVRCVDSLSKKYDALLYFWQSPSQ